MSAASGFWSGVNLGERQHDRRDVKERDEREAKLQTLVSSGLPPAQVQQGIRDIYGQDATALQRHVENLFRRVAGKQPQQAQAPMRAADLAQLESQGTTPEQRREATFRSETDYQNQAGMQAKQQEAQQDQQRVFALIDQYIPDPEANKTAKEDYARHQAGITQKFSNIPGASGQPYKSPNGTWVRPVQTADGSIVEQPMPAGYTGPVEKPPQGKTAGTSNGQNVFGFPTKEGWVDISGKPIPNFRPLPNYAQVAPSLRAIEVVNPQDPSSTRIESVPQAIREGAQGKGSIDYKMQMPTAQERGRADLAMSAREQMDAMAGILQRRSDLFGPVSGRGTDVTQWLGSQDPDAQRFAAAARIAADHLAGVFGGRSQAALEAIYKTIGENKTNPAAAIAAIEQMSQAAGRIQSRGVGPAPGGKAQKPIVQHSPSTGKYRYSLDGGRTWQNGQPPSR